MPKKLANPPTVTDSTTESPGMAAARTPRPPRTRVRPGTSAGMGTAPTGVVGAAAAAPARRARSACRRGAANASVTPAMTTGAGERQRRPEVGGGKGGTHRRRNAVETRAPGRTGAAGMARAGGRGDGMGGRGGRANDRHGRAAAMRGRCAVHSRAYGAGLHTPQVDGGELRELARFAISGGSGLVALEWNVQAILHAINLRPRSGSISCASHPLHGHEPPPGPINPPFCVGC